MGNYLLIFIIFLACTSSSLHFNRSFDVENTFRSFRVIPGHSYYINGASYNPNAVVGIQQGYYLNSPHWHAVDLDEKKLQQMVEKILYTIGVVPYNLEAYGAKILNDRGEPIGIWFSVYELPIITFTSETEFYMSSPSLQIPAINRLGADSR